MLQGDYAEATNHLKGCLQSLGRPVPTSKFDLFASLCWNVFRQLLHRLLIGRWMAAKAGSFWGIKAKDVTASAGDAALVYHKLHQLHITGKIGSIPLCLEYPLRLLRYLKHHVLHGEAYVACPLTLLNMEAMLI